MPDGGLSVTLVAERRAAADADDVAAVRCGDREAFSRLYDRHAAHVYTLALRVLGSGGDAEAVVSDVFFELWARPDKVDPSRGSCRTYLLVLARSRAIDRRRAASVRADRTEAAGREAIALRENQEPASRPLDSAVLDERRRIVCSALDRLGDRQRATLKMAYYDGMTHRQIAEQLGEPLGTIKSRIRTALITLRSALGALGGDDDALP